MEQHILPHPGRVLSCYCLGGAGVSDDRLRRGLQFVFTSTFGRITRTTRYLFKKAGNSSITGTLYFPSFSVENNFVALLGRKFDDCVKGLTTAARYWNDDMLVIVGSATSLPVPTESVDYIFCDPPFGSNIYYSEVNLLWEAWLGQLTDRDEEAVVHRQNDRGTKRLPDYSALMTAAFREMVRVLTPGRHATVEFNNSDGQVFEAIKDAVRTVGMVVENMLFLDKDQRTSKQIKGVKGEEDVVGHDVIFNLRKPDAASKRGHREPQSDIVRAVAESIADHLRTLPTRIREDPATYTDEHRTTPFLNTMLMNRLIPQGVNVSQLNLPFIEQVCARYFRKIDGRWYLRNEAVRAGNGEGVLIEHEVEISDELSAIAWLRQQLARQAMMIGEIKPLWFKATARLTSDLSTQLERLLRQNFWYDRATKRYSEPTADQRAMMDTTEREEAIHDAERFLAGHLSRPVYDDRCRWIGHLYNAASAAEEFDETAAADDDTPHQLSERARGLYEQMTRLLQGVLRENVDAKLYALAARQVRTAGRKLQHHQEARQAAEEAARAKPDPQKRLC